MPRAVWKGSLSFGLVNIPIKLYPATKDKSISFRMVHRECGSPLKYKRWCPKCEREAKSDEIDRGFEITKEKMVILSEEELEGLRLKSTRAIEIQHFVDFTSIDSIYYSSHYYVTPQEGGEKAYSVFRMALALSNRAAVGRVVMHNKEHTVVIRPYQRGLIMSSLHYADEIQNIDRLEELEELPTVGKRESELATALIEQLSGEFKPEEYSDSYRRAVMELIQQKAEGVVAPIAKPAGVEATVDLMKALEASVKVAREKKSTPTQAVS
jgi:DNA end-binding protein Ku